MLLLNCYCMIFCWCKKDLTCSIKQFHPYLKKSPSCWFFFDFHANMDDDENRYESDDGYITSYKRRVINYNDSLFNIFVQISTLRWETSCVQWAKEQIRCYGWQLSTHSRRNNPADSFGQFFHTIFRIRIFHFSSDLDFFW